MIDKLESKQEKIRLKIQKIMAVPDNPQICEPMTPEETLIKIGTMEKSLAAQGMEVNYTSENKQHLNLTSMKKQRLALKPVAPMHKKSRSDLPSLSPRNRSQSGKTMPQLDKTISQGSSHSRKLSQMSIGNSSVRTNSLIRR